MNDQKFQDPVFPGSAYDDVWKRARQKPEEFWSEAAEELIWTKKWNKVLDSSLPVAKWFTGGYINVCYNALDRHVENGYGDEVALIHDSPVTNSISKYTYSQLKNEVSVFAGVLKSYGVSKGDCVLIYMPMVPQTVIAMLATVRLGAVHSNVFGGFGAPQLATRISHCQPKVIVLCNAGIEKEKLIFYKPILEQAMLLTEWKYTQCIVYQRPHQEPAVLKPEQDVDWNDAMSSADPCDCVPIEAMDPLYILYTSGTTGDPKGIVRPAGGHAVMLNWSMYNIYGVTAEDTWWAASDLGWVVGHSYICYAPLLARVKTILYEGKPVGTPDVSAYFRVISEHGVASMFMAPTAVRAIRQEDPEAIVCKNFSMKKLRYIFVAGEHCDGETMKWIKTHFNVPVFDHWWQTETGSSITASCMGLEMSRNPPPDVSGKAVPGWEIEVLNENKEKAKPGELGTIVAKLPLPPGFMSTLYKNEKRFHELYFAQYPGYYDTMDAGTMTVDKYVSVMSRADDVINVAGHRLSTGALEEAILLHHCVVDCAVIGVPDEIKGEIPLGLYVVQKGMEKMNENEVNREIIMKVRETIGPVAAFRLIAKVDALPKTRSGKIARKSIGNLARNRTIKIPITVEDPAVYTDIKRALQKLGYALEANNFK